MTSVPFSKDAKELIRLLSVHEVRYILVGGMAVVYPGKERYRLDEKVTALPLVDISGEWRYGS